MKDVLIQAEAKHSHVMKTNDINVIPSMKQVNFEPNLHFLTMSYGS
ncbi:hypothetical protein Godav_029000 [Gossypium davidsonii]|uniref:Uncharacterized protein n=1 Tax=Gossypium davidsonii TaxID=34287 RepID=A0A7J8TAQ7_GOSDV|nr:hypothetical protein [Gossypium davidsonii]